MNIITTSLLLFFFSHANLKLLNKESICKMVKTELYSAAKYYKNLDHDLKNELFEQSIRPLAYEILNSAQLDRNHKTRLGTLVTEIAQLINGLDFRTTFANYDIQRTVDQQTSHHSSFLESVNWYSDAEAKARQEYKAMLQQLGQYVEFLKTNQDLGGKLRVSLLAEMVEMKVSNNLGMDVRDPSTFNELRQLFQIGQADATALAKMQSAKMVFEVVNKHVENFENLHSTFFMTFGKYENALFEALSKTRGQMQSIFESEKGKVMPIVAQIKKSFSDAVRQNQHYVGYANLVSNAQKKIEYQRSLIQNVEEFQHKALEAQSILKVFMHKRRRVLPEDIIVADDEIAKLENAITLINQTEPTSLINNSSTTEQLRLLKTNLGDNHMQDIQQKLAAARERKQKLLTILDKEREIDTLLGEVFAELQKNYDPRVFEICMSDHEFAIFLYYMGLTGFISSKKAFLKSYFEHLPAELHVKAARQIYLIFLDRSGVDSILIDPDWETISTDTLDNLVKNFSELMRIELTKVFENQLNHRRNPSFLKMVMNRMGIEGSDVLEGFLEVGYEHYFGQLAAALLAVIGLTTSMGIVVSIVTVFLVWLTNKLVKELIRISKNEDEFEMYKASFTKHMMTVYKFLFSNEVYSLNYVEYLSESLTTQEFSLKRILRYPNGTINEHMFTLLDSIYSGGGFFVSATFGGRRLRVVI